ncbi:hypothetical protein [Streptomyces sp. NPDC088812]|uniref:hypothetical protein n=1 Tax=Streptomyces sp. NPDC088812 TaxID=3365905 RepID=UPI003829ECF9
MESASLTATGRPLHWLPAGRTVAMRPAGQWWDAVRAPRAIALEALGRLGNRTGAVIEDPGGALLYWLVPTGRADGWKMPDDARIRVLGQASSVAVPGPQCTAGPHWRIPPTRGRALTNPVHLHNALARAAAVTAGHSASDAYNALCAHYFDCSGCAHGGRVCGDWCAHDIEPCGKGDRLRQAWVAVRWT